MSAAPKNDERGPLSRPPKKYETAAVSRVYWTANDLFSTYNALCELIAAVGAEENDMTEYQRAVLGRARETRNFVSDKMGWEK